MAETLAETLVEAGLLDREDVLKALGLQRARGGTLDTALLEQGHLSAQSILRVLGQHHQLDFVSRDDIDKINPQIVDDFPRHYAETYRVVPLRKVGDSIKLLAAIPPHERVLERIRNRTKLRPTTVITLEAFIHYGMEKLYGKKPPDRYSVLLEKLAKAPRDEEVLPNLSPTQMHQAITRRTPTTSIVLAAITTAATATTFPRRQAF